MKYDKDYLFGDLLRSTPPAFEEPILILLAMFRVCFPAGNAIAVPQSHQVFYKTGQQPRTLLTRIFSLFPLPHELTVSEKDFELAVFASYT